MSDNPKSPQLFADNTVRACLLFICFVLGVYSLHATQNLLAPFALAIFIWLIIDAFAQWIDGLSPKVPYWLALTIALLVVFMGLVGVVVVVADTGRSIMTDSGKYAARINEIFGSVNSFLSKSEWVSRNVDLSSEGISERFDVAGTVQRIIAGLISSVSGVLSNFFLIATYVAFLFVAQNGFRKRVDDLWPDINERARATKVMDRIRVSVEKYVGVQTLMSLIQTILSYIVMVLFGLDNALFWAMVIFILNFIPIVGGILAVVFPVLFAVVQFETFTKVGGLAGGLFLVQFIINNTLQPKMMGDSMNMSSLVVILALAMWTALWGGVGAFLSAPLTVIMMIILAQFASTRWISILLSADGKPDMDENEKLASEAKPAM